MIRTIFQAILTEALVELFFTAAPLQGVRARLINRTPVLRSKEQGHLLECKYCTSVWISAGVVLLAERANCKALRLASAALVVARISNYAHLIYSSIRDYQINKLLERDEP